MFARQPLDLGPGRWRAVAAVLGWDFLYYWNHRLSHESRWLWAVHVVAPLQRALQPLDRPAPTGGRGRHPHRALRPAGAARRASGADRARPRDQPDLPVLDPHRDDPAGSAGWRRCSTPRRTTGCTTARNREYLDRNHGSILILWDRLFGTFEEEDEPVVYGLTRNIDTFNPLRIATHEWRDIARDVADADTWHDRWSFLLRGPGWAYARRPCPVRALA